eukprot:COSAG05_NODE_229_length_13378_cov_4.728594_7_plen_80_part_00
MGALTIAQKAIMGSHKGQTITQKILISSRRQTIAHEERYLTWVLGSTGEYQESSDEVPNEEHDLHDLLHSNAEDSDEKE